MSSGEEEEESAEESEVPGAADSQLSRAQRARVSQLIGDVMARVGRLPDALSYFQAARNLETSAATRRVLNRKIAETRAALKLQHGNAARRPLLHEALEQDRVVRPRLMARSSPSSSVRAKGAVKQ